MNAIERRSPMDKVQCPFCGGMFDPNEMVFLDNGNIACPECVAREEKEDEGE